MSTGASRTGAVGGALVVAVLLAGIAAAKPTVSMSTSVRKANLVVVGQPIDRPAASQPEGPYRFRIERTLMGFDVTGVELMVWPRGLAFDVGKSYVVFLTRHGIAPKATAAPQRRTEATEATIAEARRTIARHGGSVGPKPVLWMRHVGGWGAGVLGEFFVTADGTFQWWRTPPTRDEPKGPARSEILAGTLPKAEVGKLVTVVAGADKGPPAEDAGTVQFHWLDRAGVFRERLYMHPGKEPSRSLEAAIAALARKHGKPVPRRWSPPGSSEAVINGIRKQYPGANFTPLRSSHRAIGGLREIANPLQGYRFLCVLLRQTDAAPVRQYLCIAEDGRTAWPFDVTKLFGELMAAQDTSSWSDKRFAEAARLYVHLTAESNEDGYVVLETPEQFLAMSIGGVRLQRHEKLASQLVRPSVVRRGDSTTIRFCTWHWIGGYLSEWMLQFGPRFKAVSKSLGRIGGGGYK